MKTSVDGNRRDPLRIVVIIRNTVTRDARVRKEAAALMRAGHQVTVIGISKGPGIPHRETLEPGIDVVRVPWRSSHYRRTAALQIAAVTTLVATTVVLGALWWLGVLPRFQPRVLDRAFEFVNDRGALWLVGLTAIVVATQRLGARAQTLRRWSRRHAAIEGGRQPPSPPPYTRWQRMRRHVGDQIDQIAALRRPRRVVRRWTTSLLRRGRLPGAVAAAHVRAHFDVGTLIGPVRAIVDDIAPDVIHAHEVNGLRLAIRANRRTRAHIVYDAHEIYEDLAHRDPARAHLARHLHRRAQRHVDSFVTISDAIAAFYAQRYPRLPPAVVVRNAAERRDVHDDGRLHRAAHLPPEQHVLLFQGGLTPHRGLDATLDAASDLPDDWTIVLMGWGALEDQLRQRSLRVGADAPPRRHPRIVFVPPVPHEELHLWTAGASVGIIPYEDVSLNHHLCTPNKLWEFPAAGVPLLVSPLPELVSAVERYGLGWVIPAPVTGSTIAESLRMLDDDALAAARAGCHAFIQDDHWGVHAGRLTDLYASLSPRR